MELATVTPLLAKTASNAAVFCSVSDQVGVLGGAVTEPPG
jgi:hypothetical protein